MISIFSTLSLGQQRRLSFQWYQFFSTLSPGEQRQPSFQWYQFSPHCLQANKDGPHSNDINFLHIVSRLTKTALIPMISIFSTLSLGEQRRPSFQWYQFSPHCLQANKDGSHSNDINFLHVVSRLTKTALIPMISIFSTLSLGQQRRPSFQWYQFSPHCL